MDLSKILLHPSALSKVMTEPKSKADKEAGELSEGAKTEVISIWKEHKYDRIKQYTNKYTQKGIKHEDHAIDLYSEIKDRLFVKNKEYFKNDFLIGTPDLTDNKDFKKIKIGIDVKSSWDLHTFPIKLKNKPLLLDKDLLSDNYFWQNMGYMALIPSAEKWITAYCLVNSPAKEITRAKLQWYYALDMNESEENAEEYLYRCIEVEKNMIFDIRLFKQENPNFDLDCTEWNYDIPKEERVVEYTIERNEEDIKRIYEQVSKARRFIKNHLL